MEAIHFGDPVRPLFGLHHGARGAARQTAVLLCHGWGPEYMRAYRGMQTLAIALADLGFESLRFDYSGTGDSEGHALDARLEYWLADTQIAARELLDLSGASRIALLGHRSGAVLAAEACRRGLDASCLLALDAPASGSDFVADMQRVGQAEDDRKNRYRSHGNELPEGEADELCGHAWPAKLAASFLSLPGASHQNLRWLQSKDHRTPAPDGAPVWTLDYPGHWHNPAWINSPWCPTPALQRLAAECATWLT